jgi:death on curing protein
LNPEFLDVDDVLELHADQIAEHGGSDGVRDLGLLESAVAQPMAKFDGQFLHQDLFQMAAALHFSLVSNHPFIDGNKRTAVLAALTFLGINGHSIGREHRVLLDLTLEVAEGRVSEDAVTELFRDLAAGFGG